MSDYKDIIRKPETLNWFKAAMGMKITRDCLANILKEATQEFYHNIRRGIKRKHGIPENVVCSQCHTPNVLPCPNNKLCNVLCQEIVDNHRYRNRSKPQSFHGPTWVNTDASQWCADTWQIAKCYLSKDGYKDVNQAEETDFNGVVNAIYNCEFFQVYFKDDLTQNENVCTKARDVGREVRHSSTMSMTSQDSDSAIDTLVALVQSLKHVDHQAASKTTVDKLTQLKNGTLAITTEDVATAFEEHLKENLTAEIKEALEKDKDRIVKEIEVALNKNMNKARDDALETMQRKENEALIVIDNAEKAAKSSILSMTANTFKYKHAEMTGDRNTSPKVEILYSRSSTLSSRYYAVLSTQVT